MEQSIKCIAYNGRYLMMGFASDKKYVDEKLIVPRAVAAGNFKLCGVLLSYAPPAGRADDEEGHGLELRLRRARRADHARDRRSRAREAGQARDRPRRRVRGAPVGDRGDGEPRDGRPHDREAVWQSSPRLPSDRSVGRRVQRTSFDSGHSPLGRCPLDWTLEPLRTHGLRAQAGHAPRARIEARRRLVSGQVMRRRRFRASGVGGLSSVYLPSGPACELTETRASVLCAVEHIGARVRCEDTSIG